MQIMSCLSLTMDWHGLLLQYMPGAIIGLSFCILAFVIVKNLVLVLACSICVIECTALLCLAIWCVGWRMLMLATCPCHC